MRLSLKWLTRLMFFSSLCAAASMTYAQSVYDGIWKYDSPVGSTYYALTITGSSLILISLSEIAKFQDPLMGTYIGTISVDLARDYQGSVLEGLARLTVPRDSVGYLNSYEIYFLDTKTAVMQAPKRDFPTAGLPPLLPFTKIF